MKRKPLRLVVVPLLLANLLMVSYAVAAGCTVSSVAVNFGRFNPLSLSSVTSTGNITVNCTDVDVYSIAISSGNGTYSQRSMVSAGNSLLYNLYRDAAYQQVWGDGSSGNSNTVTISNPLNSQNNIHTVYGSIPLSIQRAVHIGTYSDSMTVTVSY